MRTEPLAAINSVALGIGRFASLDEMLDHALLKVLEVVQTEAGSVYLLDEDHGDLLLAVSHGLSPAVQRDFNHLQLGEGLSGTSSTSDFRRVLAWLLSSVVGIRLARIEESLRISQRSCQGSCP